MLGRSGSKFAVSQALFCTAMAIAALPPLPGRQDGLRAVGAFGVQRVDSCWQTPAKIMPPKRPRLQNATPPRGVVVQLVVGLKGVSMIGYNPRRGFPLGS